MTRKEAINKVRKMNLSKETMEILSALEPELADSEDERTRKWILEYLYDGLRKSDEQFKDQFKSAIAYLEKQKAKERLDRMAPIYNDKESFESALEKAWKYYNESASRTVDSFEDDYIECVFSKGFREGFLYREKQKEQNPTEYLPKRKVYDIMNKLTELSTSTLIPVKSEEYVKIHEITSDVRSLLDYPIEQKSTEWSEADESFLDSIEDAISSYYDLNHAPQYHYWLEEKLKSIRPVKQEWSEEDERMLSRCIKSVECSKQFADSKSYKAAKDVEMNWLKSLSERFNLQPKQEWSDEDKGRIKQLIYDTEFVKAHYEKRKEELGERFNNILIEDCDEQIAWLKSLRPPQYCENCKLKRSVENWKPSREQMEALNEACVLKQVLLKRDILESLYNDLKKLK